MATVRSEVSNVAVLETISSDNFESIIKERMTWSRKKWELIGQEDSRMHRLTNSLNYWGKKLKPAMESSNVIVTLYNCDNDVTVGLLDFVDAILNLDKEVDIIGYSEFRNPKYLSIYFKDEETKIYVEKNLRTLNDNLVVYLSWALTPTLKKVKVHWLTMTMDERTIKQSLEPYIEIKDQKKDSTTLLSGKILKAGKVTFEAKLKEGIDAADVPHIMYIGGLEALITIQGRPPLCLTCDRIGHIAKHCPTPFCGRCRSLKARGHACTESQSMRSYANVVKTGDIAVDFDDWSDPLITNPLGPLCSVKVETTQLLSPQQEHAFTKEVTSSELLDNSLLLKIGKEFQKQNKKQDALNLDSYVSEKVDKPFDDINDSEFDDTETGSTATEVVKKMENYLKELNDFKMTIQEEGGGCIDVGLRRDEVGSSSNSNEMVVDPQNLKRKIVEKSAVEAAGQEQHGWIRNYSRKNKHRGRRRVTEDSFLGDDPGQREFTFSD